MGALEYIGSALLALTEIAILLRAILRPHRDPASRLAWVVVIVVLPIAGILAYLLLGEIRISNARRQRGRDVDRALPTPDADESCDGSACEERLCRAVRTGPLRQRARDDRGQPGAARTRQQRGDRRPGRGHRRSEHHVHLCAYIWLADHNGCKVKDAVIRAAARGVKVRALADALGSRLFIRSGHWRRADRERRRRPRRASGRRALVDYHPRPGRPAQSSQADGHRQPYRMGWEPERRRPRIPNQAALRAMGRHHDPLGRTGRPPLPISVCV